MVDTSHMVISGLSNMLESKNPLFLASGAYAVGVLAQYHRTENPLLLQTHEGFLNIMNKVRKLANHGDPMVRRQAGIALSKFQKIALAA
jgi:hypothetical protein